MSGTKGELPAQLFTNVEAMTAPENGFDVVIVCCGTDAHMNYWQSRLEDGLGSILPATALPLAVSEQSWDGGSGSGAGNALGTLFAYRQAEEKAAERGMADMTAKLLAGEISVGMYHTAGKGTRLAPLPGSENNNKPAVRLPALVELKSGAKPITILEAVMKQTGVYAASRKGRLSVFIPTVPAEYTPAAHVDLLAKLGPMPSPAEWAANGLEKYGLVAVSASGEAAQVEKVTHEQATEMLGTLGPVTKVGTSLGSFSVTAVFLRELLAEYSAELEAKSGAKDTDPHWWMPLTLGLPAYIAMMAKKGASREDAEQDYARVQRVKAQSLAKGGASTMFGAVDVGQDCCWWDYGQLKLFKASMALVRSNEAEAALYRTFLEIPSRVNASEIGAATADDGSLVQGCQFMSGSVADSIACNVYAEHVEAEGAILINVTARKVIAKPGSVVYNVVDDSADGIRVEENIACVGVWDEEGASFLMKTDATEDQKQYWKVVREDMGNATSYHNIYEENLATDVMKVEDMRDEGHLSVRCTMASPDDATCAIL